MAEGIIGRIWKFKEKVRESHHDIEHVFNKEVKGHLSKFEIQKHTPEECRDLSNALTETLLEIEENVRYTQTTVKDMLQKATIHVLQNTVRAFDKERSDCKCKDVLLREEHKKAKDRPKGLVDSGIGIPSLTDSRLISDQDGLVAQPTDASDDKVDSNADKDTYYMDTRL